MVRFRRVLVETIVNSVASDLLHRLPLCALHCSYPTHGAHVWGQGRGAGAMLTLLVRGTGRNSTHVTSRQCSSAWHPSPNKVCLPPGGEGGSPSLGHDTRAMMLVVENQPFPASSSSSDQAMLVHAFAKLPTRFAEIHEAMSQWPSSQGHEQVLPGCARGSDHTNKLDGTGRNLHRSSCAGHPSRISFPALSTS